MRILSAIERSIRRATLASLHYFSSSEEVGTKRILPEQREKIERILLIRVDRIGDVLISTPVIRQLRNHFPTTRIDLLLGHKNWMVAPLIAEINRHYVLPKSFVKIVRTIRELRKNRYDVVINFHLNPSGSADLISRLAKGKYLVERTEGEQVMVGEDIIVQTSRLLSSLGIETISPESEEEHRLNITLPPNVERKDESTEMVSVALNVSVAGAGRRWPEEHYVALTTLIREEGMLPTIVGAPGDRELMERIAIASSTQFIEPTNNFSTFVGVLTGFDILVTPDTSVVHLAAALRKPVIPLYASEKAGTEWRPWGTESEPIIELGGMELITPERVLEHIIRIMRVKREELRTTESKVEGDIQ